MIQSVERAIAILRCFEDHEELGVTAISQMTGLHKSTTFGIINTLRKEKVLRTNEKTGCLRLGLELFRLGANIKIDLKTICAPFLDYLLEFTKETVNLMIRDEDSVVYIEKKESPHSMRICTKIGQQLPLYSTAGGKAILAFLKEDELHSYLSRVKLKSFTEKTLKTKNELQNQLVKIRSDGCAYDNEELEYGLICIGVPILSRQSHPAGALSVSGPSIRMNREKRAEIRELLLAQAALAREKL
jgi:DNA-binding IclR family transcriptional regulator